MKTKEKQMAIELREKGCSFNAISKQLGVSKSTAHSWTRNVELTPKLQKQLLANKKCGAVKGCNRHAEEARERRLLWQNEGRNYAKKGDLRHAMGCMLYWGEGRKAKNSVGVSNTDAGILQFVKEFLDRYFEPHPTEYTISVNCYLNNGLTTDEIERYWLGVLFLPESCLRASTFKEGADEQTFRKNRHVYGVCTLRLNRTDIVQHIFGAIQEYSGVDRVEWLG